MAKQLENVPSKSVGAPFGTYPNTYKMYGQRFSHKVSGTNLQQKIKGSTFMNNRGIVRHTDIGPKAVS